MGNAGRTRLSGVRCGDDIVIEEMQVDDIVRAIFTESVRVG